MHTGRCATCGQEIPERMLRIGDRFRIGLDQDPYILAWVDWDKMNLIDTKTGGRWCDPIKWVSSCIPESDFERLLIGAARQWEKIERDEDA